jgi:hypothetical protein
MLKIVRILANPRGEILGIRPGRGVILVTNPQYNDPWLNRYYFGLKSISLYRVFAVSSSQCAGVAAPAAAVALTRSSALVARKAVLGQAYPTDVGKFSLPLSCIRQENSLCRVTLIVRLLYRGIYYFAIIL